MELSQIQAIANAAASDPSRAAVLAKIVVAELQAIVDGGETETPNGYLYAPAHTFIVETNNLEVETIPQVPLTSTGNGRVNFKIPFDCLILGVAGWAQVTATGQTESSPTLFDQQTAIQLSSAEESRDLFSVSWGLDGQIIFSTDGFDPQMYPASVTVGTRKRPRRMAWTLRRNQTLNVQFRNITNVLTDGLSAEVFGPVILAKAALAFYALNLEAA